MSSSSTTPFNAKKAKEHLDSDLGKAVREIRSDCYLLGRPSSSRPGKSTVVAIAPDVHDLFTSWESNGQERGWKIATNIENNPYNLTVEVSGALHAQSL
jgi:hypothetical protein